MQRADRAFGVFMGLLTAVFVVIAVVLNAMLWWLVIRPVTRLSALADRVSLGELDDAGVRSAGAATRSACSRSRSSACKRASAGAQDVGAAGMSPPGRSQGDRSHSGATGAQRQGASQ